MRADKARMSMRKWWLWVGLLVSGLWSNPSFAGSGPYSLGLMIGGPSGISAGYQLNSRHVLDFALSWTSSRPLYIHGDYLWQPYRRLKVDTVTLDFFWGAGGRFFTRDASNKSETVLGARFPFGLRYQWDDPSILVFGEIALNLDLVPDTAFEGAVAVGVRYIF